jgi:hypothetical protein
MPRHVVVLGAISWLAADLSVRACWEWVGADFAAHNLGLCEAENRCIMAVVVLLTCTRWFALYKCMCMLCCTMSKYEAVLQALTLLAAAVGSFTSPYALQAAVAWPSPKQHLLTEG